MRIFVTGGTGFVGQATIARLKRDGHRLLILSRTASGRDFLRGDLASADRWRKKLEAFKPDWILYLAWENIPDYSAENNLRNLIYNANLIKIAAEIGCKSFLGMGTNWEYGDLGGKLKETSEVKPIKPFPFTKNILRCLGEQMAQEKAMQFVWIRLFYVYGPGQKPDSLIPYLIRCVRDGREPEVKNPKGGNDFIYIDDAADAIALIIKKCKSKNAVYNIGSGKLTAIKAIVNTIFHKKDKYPKPTGYWADLSKIKKEIGWQPKIDITTGIKKTLAAYGVE